MYRTLLRREDRQKPCDIETVVELPGYLRVQPEMLHISHHYEWIHLPPEYLTSLQITLQITSELLIPIDWRELVRSILVQGSDDAFTETGMCDLWFYDLYV